MRWQLHNDGSYDLIGDSVTIRGCYPSFDGIPIRPVAVQIATDANGGTASFDLQDGRFDLRLGRDGDELTIQSSLRDAKTAPHWVSPLHGGCVTDLHQVYRQGLGIGGPSGLVDMDFPGGAPLTSHALTALVDASGDTLSLAAMDHRRFIQRTVLYPPGIDGGTLPTLDAGFRTECIPLANETLDLPALHIRLGRDAWSCLRATASAIAAEMACRTTAPTSYHWCSWYYLYHNLTEPLLDEYLDGFRAVSPPITLQSVQIDAGYFPAAGDWLEHTPYWPHGLQRAFQQIRQAGYRPGIWIGPYMVGNRSRVFADHPEWMLKDRDGCPLAPWQRYNEPKPWGYRDEETHVLDTSHPEAMDYLRRVFRTFRAWGAELFKTDFMLWGLQDSATVSRHTPGKTSVEYFRELLAVIREEIGDESYWLGCIAPYAPFLGYADGMRIGGDVGAAWQKEGFGPWNMIRESQGMQPVNNVWWQNDPDAILLRDRFIWLTEAEIRSLALWQGILGGVINTSAPLHEIPRARADLWRFLRPGATAWTAKLPYLGKCRKLLVAVRAFEGATWAVLVFNPCEEPQTEVLAIQDLIGETDAFCFKWDPPTASPMGSQSRLVPELEPHACALYYIACSDSPPPQGLTLGGAIDTP